MTFRASDRETTLIDSVTVQSVPSKKEEIWILMVYAYIRATISRDYVNVRKCCVNERVAINVKVFPPTRSKRESYDMFKAATLTNQDF